LDHGGGSKELGVNQGEVETARLVQRCLIEALKEIARRCNGVAVEQRGLFLAAGNHPYPGLVNSVLRTGEMDAAEVLARAETFFGELENQYELWTRKGVDEDLEKAAQDAGMRFAGEFSGMVMHEAPEVGDAPEGVDVRRVRDAADAREFAKVAAEAFRGEAPGAEEVVRAIFRDAESLLGEETAAFVARDHGKPASVAMTMMKEGVAWIGWVGTIPEMRGRGLGRLTTAAATRAGFALGGKFASLEATKMGLPVYRRLGYREIVRYRNYWSQEERER